MLTLWLKTIRIVKKNVLLPIFITMFIDLLGFGIVIPILPNYIKEIGSTDLMVGVVASSFSFMQFIFAPMWGNLSDRIGRRPVLLMSLAGTAVAYSFFGLGSIWLLLLSRTLAGIGSANLSVAQAYIADVTAPEKRARAMGMIGAAFGLGFIFGPPIGGFLKEHYGVASVGYFTAALCIMNLILTFFMLPESLKVKNTQKRTAKDAFKDIFLVSQRPIIKDIFLLNFIYIGAYAAIQITCALLWKDVYHLTDKQIGYVFAFIGVWAAIIQGGLIGFISRKMGEKRMLVNGFVILAVGILFLPFIPLHLFMPLEYLCLMIMGFANGMLMPAIGSTTSKLSGANEQGKVLGVMQSIGSLARGIGPIVGGFLYGLNYHSAFVVSSAFMVLGIFLSRNFVKKHLS